MTRKRWLVLSVGQDCLDDPKNQHGAAPAPEALWRIRLRAPEKMEPTYVLYVSQPPDKAAPYALGGVADLDERLLTAEQEEGAD